MDEICYLDLQTWTWSRTWSFVPRFDHSAWVWGGKIWVFGGLGTDMERTGDLWWLDLKSSPAFRSVPSYGNVESPQIDRSHARPNHVQYHQPSGITGSTGYAANSSSVQVRGSSLCAKSVAPGSMSSVRFISGPDIPPPATGTHYYAYSSGSILDFVTPASMSRPLDTNLSALDLNTLQWQKLASGGEIFDSSYRWSYCAVNEDGTKAWLLGCAIENPDNGFTVPEEYLSDVVPLDLRRFGLLGNDVASQSSPDERNLPASDTHQTSNLSSLGADLACMFDQKTGSGSDFVVTALKDDMDDEMLTASTSTATDAMLGPHSPNESASTWHEIHVHKLILQARWPHFNRLYKAEMSEFHTKKLHIPEPYTVVRAFLYYLYTDSIARHPEYCRDLDDVAGLLVMAQIYDMPRLRLLCLNRLSRELDVEHAAVIWERAGTAQDEWLQKRAATYCLTYWGRVVRSQGFRQLSRRSMMELCEVIDVEGRVVGGEELEMIGGLGGSKFGTGTTIDVPRRRAVSQTGTTADEDNDAAEDEGMELS